MSPACATFDFPECWAEVQTLLNARHYCDLKKALPATDKLAYGQIDGKATLLLIHTLFSKPYAQTLTPLPRPFTATIDLGALSDDQFIPTASWYAQVCVACTGAYCQCDNTAAKATIETLKFDGRTVNMITACIILSAFCPLFLVIFWVADAIKYNKTGRAIKLFYYH